MNEVKVSSFFYEVSDSREVQGKYDVVIKRYSKEWNINRQGGGNGNWLLTKPSGLHVKCGNNMVNLRSEVLDYYGKQKLTRKLAERFESQLNDNEIAVFVNDYGNYIIQKVNK